MAAPDWISIFVEPLDRLQIIYMITGSVGAMAYGEPRATMDIDIVIRLASSQVPRRLNPAERRRSEIRQRVREFVLHGGA